MSTESRRQFLVGIIASVLLVAVGCVGDDLYGRLTTLEANGTLGRIDTAVVKKDIEDFRKSFEEFKADVKQDLERHHK